jgi:hypothetical protein
VTNIAKDCTLACRPDATDRDLPQGSEYRPADGAHDSHKQSQVVVSLDDESFFGRHFE